MIHISFDGRIISTNVYRIYVRRTTSKYAGINKIAFTCNKGCLIPQRAPACQIYRKTHNAIMAEEFLHLSNYRKEKQKKNQCENFILFLEIFLPTGYFLPDCIKIEAERKTILNCFLPTVWKHVITISVIPKGDCGRVNFQIVLLFEFTKAVQSEYPAESLKNTQPLNRSLFLLSFIIFVLDFIHLQKKNKKSFLF